MYRKYKVIHFVPSIQRGGAERQVATIIQNCTSFQHWLVTLHYDQDNYFTDNRMVGIIHCKKLIGRIFELNSIIKSVKPDVVYTWGVLPYLLSTMVSNGRKIRVINGSIRHGVFKSSLGGYLRLILLHCSKYVVANSRSGLKANKLRKGIVLYNGIDERFNRKNHMQDESQDIRSGRTVFISVANLVPYKDYETVFQALSKLKQKGVAFSYHIIGDGPLRGQYESLSVSMGIKENVLFHGRVANPEKYLARSDIFIHSSKGEGCSNAILEAMYMGLPIVASDTGGTSEITGANSILFPYKDSHALFEALYSLGHDAKLVKFMGDESYKIASEKFSLDTMINDYSRIISAIYDDNLDALSDLSYSSKG